MGFQRKARESTLLHAVPRTAKKARSEAAIETSLETAALGVDPRASSVSMTVPPPQLAVPLPQLASLPPLSIIQAIPNSRLKQTASIRQQDALSESASDSEDTSHISARSPPPKRSSQQASLDRFDKMQAKQAKTEESAD